MIEHRCSVSRSTPHIQDMSATMNPGEKVLACVGVLSSSHNGGHKSSRMNGPYVVQISSRRVQYSCWFIRRIFEGQSRKRRYILGGIVICISRRAHIVGSVHFLHRLQNKLITPRTRSSIITGKKPVRKLKGPHLCNNITFNQPAVFHIHDQFLIRISAAEPRHA